MHFFKTLLLITISCISLAISDRSKQPLRFWIDEYNFSKGETQLLRDSILSSNGAAHLTGETLASFLTTKGHQALPTFDVYWTGKQGCYLAFQQALNKHHLVTCAPGLDAITGKSDLIYSLVSAYGQDTAAFIVPPSYRLPSQYFHLARYIQNNYNNNNTSSTTWIMKQNMHRGKGVKVVPASQVLQHALIKDKNSREQQYVLAQKFIANQYLIANRPFYIRVWAVVIGLYPLKLYLYDGGVVVFGSEQNNTTTSGNKNVNDPNNMIVNLWTQDRKAALPWGFPQLKAHIADDAVYNTLMGKLQTSLAATVASAYPAMQRRTASSAPGHQGGSLEIIGVDYLVDDFMHPWLVEVNWLPSLARKVLQCGNNDNDNDNDCQYGNPFDIEKQKFVSSLLQLLIQRHGYIDRAELKASKIVSEAENEMCLDADDIEQLMLAQMEGQAAVKLGFINLTSLVYQGLDCMSSGDENHTDTDMCKDKLLSILDRKKGTENTASKETVTNTVLSQQQQWWWAIDWSVAYSSVVAKRVHGKKEYHWNVRTRALMHIMLEESSLQFWRSSEALTFRQISEACK